MSGENGVKEQKHHGSVICFSGLKVSGVNNEEWNQKLLRVRLEALVGVGTEQSAEEALDILSQVPSHSIFGIFVRFHSVVVVLSAKNVSLSDGRC